MKKYITLLAVAGLMASCGEDSKKDNADSDNTESTENSEGTDLSKEEAPQMTLDNLLDLSQYELPVAVPVPEGTVVDNQSYGTYVNNGPAFDFEVAMDYYESVEERKEEMADNDVNVLKSYVVDMPNGYVAETEVMGKTEYHVFYLLEGDGFTISFENQKGRSFSRAEAEFMFKSFAAAKPLEYVEEY